MEIEGMDFLDWLHKIRRESEQEQKRQGIDGVEWLRRISGKSRLLKRRRPGPKTAGARSSAPGRTP